MDLVLLPLAVGITSVNFIIPSMDLVLLPFAVGITSVLPSFPVFILFFALAGIATLGIIYMSDAGVTQHPVPGRRCPNCLEKGDTVWVIPVNNCPQCTTPVK
jgi:hypothetical protein